MRETIVTYELGGCVNGESISLAGTGSVRPDEGSCDLVLGVIRESACWDPVLAVPLNQV